MATTLAAGSIGDDRRRVATAARAGSLSLAAPVQVTLVMLACCALYAFTIGITPIRVDEFYTLFAANSWAREGSFRILAGSYDRAWLFTMLTGGIFLLTGTANVTVARLVPLLATGLTVALLFAWTRRHVGVAGALVAAALLGLSGWAIDVAHFARFYALQGLLIFVAAMLLHDVRYGRTPRWPRAVGAALALALAVHLQPTSLGAVLALTLWVTPAFLRRVMALPAARLPLGASLAAILVILALTVSWPLMEAAALRFGTASAWAADHQDDALFYLRTYWRQMPLLLVLLPIAAMMALRRNPTLAALALIMLLVPVALQSFAAMKAARYCYYVIPFLALLYGLAFARGLETAGRQTAVIALCLGAAALLIANPAYRHTGRTLRLAVDRALIDPAHLTRPEDPLWAAQAPALRRLVAPADLLVTADDLRTVAYVRPYAVLINASQLSDLGTRRDFTIDPRTGRPIVASPAGVDRLLRCLPAGVLLVDEPHWRVAKGITPAAADRIERGARRDPAAPPHFLLFRWHHAPQPCAPLLPTAGPSA